MSGTEIHLYLDELEPGSVIHIHADRKPDSGPSAPRRRSVEEMTVRLTAYANGANTLAMIDGLRALGCELRAPEVRRPSNSPQVYLNVYAPASSGGAMLYLYPKVANPGRVRGGSPGGRLLRRARAQRTQRRRAPSDTRMPPLQAWREVRR